MGGGAGSLTEALVTLHPLLGSALTCLGQGREADSHCLGSPLWEE